MASNPEFFLAAKTRAPAKHEARRLRAAGVVPGVIYGHGFPTRHLEVAAAPFAKLLHSTGASTLVGLAVDGSAPVKVLIADVQHDTLTGSPMHVDFHQVSMTERVTAEVTLTFTGESPAVKEQSGVLVRNLDHVRVEGLPGDLVPEIPVDIGALKDFASRILVRDLTVPKGLRVLDSADEVVVLVEPPRSEEELAALSEKVEEKVEEVSVVEKPGKELEEPIAEGEAPQKPEKA